MLLAQPTLALTYSQWLMRLEHVFDCTIIYNPKELPSTDVPPSVYTLSSPEQTISQVLGANYQVYRRHSMITITYRPVIQFPILVIDTPIKQARESFPSIALPPIPLLQVNSLPKTVLTIPTCAQTDTIAPIQSQRSQHYLTLNLGVGGGSIAISPSLCVILDLDYAYFFHSNWGVGLGVGVDYFNRDLLTCSLPLTIQMQYPMKDNWAIHGGVGLSTELPISGTLSEDDSGTRYSQSVLFAPLADLGAVYTIHPNWQIGFSIYARCVTFSVGDIRTQLGHLYPWQVGISVSLSYIR